MGCRVSTTERVISTKRKNTDKGIATMREPVDNANAKFDPRLPLTVRQKYNIMKSWKGIARNIEETGIMMFLRLFETNEEVKAMFTKLIRGSRTDISNLRESKELEYHVRQVMYTLDEAISSLEDVDDVVQNLLTVGRGHRRLTHLGFNPEVFWKIEEPFLLAVKEILGDRYTANMEHIYRKTIKFILETLMEGYNSAAGDDMD